MTKKELILDGLCCANCAAKIEQEVNAIPGITASMNFISKTLVIETAAADSETAGIVEQVKTIVYKHEPGVLVKEKLVINSLRKVFILEGLCCANCASKIETEVGKQAGVTAASIDFISKKLTLKTEPQVSLSALFQQIEAIVNKIEPGVRVILADNQANPGAPELARQEGEEGGQRKKLLTKLALGGTLFAVVLLFSLPDWLEISLFLVSYLIVGGDVVWRAIKGIASGQVFSEHFLMTVATIGAFLVGQYPEGVAVMMFYLVGELFQDMAVDHSRKSISALMDIRPDYANLKVGDSFRKVAPEEVKVGDIILVKPGEKIPLDGVVDAGISMADTSALTGESLPRELAPGAAALSGFINKNGVLTIKVTKTFGESTVAKILDLVQNASSRKAPTEKFITKFARYYTPAVVFAALALGVIPPLLIPGATFADWIYRALIFLVVSCPCALVISIPLGFFGGIGGASKMGILIKGSNYLEALNSVETVVFDKTGTLTKGVFKVTEINPQSGFSAAALLDYAAHAESFSNHPIAKSIVTAYPEEIQQDRIQNHQELPGSGLRVTIDNQEVLAGNSRLMADKNIPISPFETLGTVVYLAVDQVYAGHLIISDEVKEDAAQAIKSLKAIGIKKTVMLTGDLKQVGDQIGQQLGLDQVYSELLPADKVDKFEWLESHKSNKEKIIFVGDGINDAPVLARADIGMAMGGLGSDAAIEAADIVIMTDEPSKIVTAIKIARKTRKIVLQNIVFALGIKAVFLIMAMFGVATMWEAVFADVGVTLIAVFNAMRVMNTKNI
ncbi:MAG: cadmium-translocating P-type ATPase [Acetobacterium woodii]|nr:cadmium-translocating P-type ATPase [Acetobacterium woodii]